ncbi:ABC transporter permease subunit [Bradyrhizobium sp. DN5]|uniref:ABC transporter permease subunit n=1 Tax=Bradyrhizobium sp. DN5 TaxID=3056950 RepID=UPI003525356C
MKTLHKWARMPIGLTVPALAILLFAFGIPMLQLFFTSLNAPNLSVANYRDFFLHQSNVTVLLQTIEISVVATAICLVLGYPIAYLIVAAPKRLKVVLTVLVFIPWLTSGLVRTYAWTIILGDHGLINNLLLNTGLISSPLQLLYNRLAVYIGMVHIMLPMMILPLLSVMQGIDKSLLAAARSMGAQPLAAFWRVFFPLSLPGVRSGSLLVFVVCLGFYITPQALGGLRDAMLSTFIVAQVQTSFNIARAAASAFILLGIAVVILSIFGLDLSAAHRGAARSAEDTWRRRLPSFGALSRGMKEVLIPYRANRWASQLYMAGRNGRWSETLGAAYAVLFMIFLLCPGVIVIIMSFSAGEFLEFPPSGLSLQWYRSFFGDSSWTEAVWNSARIAFLVALLSTVVGTLAAYGLSRTFPRLRAFLTMVILSPITFPVIVVGIAIYFGLVKLGLIGTLAGIVLAHSIGAIGTVVVIVAATLAQFDRRLEQAAQSLRAGPLQTFLRVTLPLISPGIIGGAMFAFIHSFDEVVITSLVSGFSLRTLPLKMLENIRQQIDPTIAAVGALLTFLPVVWLIALYFMWWRKRPASQHLEPAT